MPRLLPLLLAAPWILGPIVTVVRARFSRSLDDESAEPPPDAPLVSLVIPARNEARNIRRCVGVGARVALSAARGDRRRRPLHRRHRRDRGTSWRRRDSRLRVITPPALPDGWFGKQWACATGAAAARGELLGFMDADTWQAPDLVTRVVNAMRARGSDLLSVAGMQELGSFWERMIQPQIFAIMLQRFGGTELVNRSRSRVAEDRERAVHLGAPRRVRRARRPRRGEARGRGGSGARAALVPRGPHRDAGARPRAALDADVHVAARARRGLGEEHLRGRAQGDAPRRVRPRDLSAAAGDAGPARRGAAARARARAARRRRQRSADVGGDRHGRESGVVAARVPRGCGCRRRTRCCTRSARRWCCTSRSARSRAEGGCGGRSGTTGQGSSVAAAARPGARCSFADARVGPVTNRTQGLPTLRACEPSVTPPRCSAPRSRSTRSSRSPPSSRSSRSRSHSTTPRAPALGIPDDAGEARLVRGRGALRALIVCTRPHGAAACAVHAARVGAQLACGLRALGPARRRPAGGEVGVACWTRSGRAPRLVALVARRDHVVASDAEALAALAASPGDDDLLTHTRWCELLGREALSRRFYRTLEQCVGGLAELTASACTTDDRARARAAGRVAAALPLLPRGEGLARRRPRLPRATVRRVHGARRRLPRARAPAALVRHAQHADPPSRARGARVRRDPVPERRPVRQDGARAAALARSLLRRSARSLLRRRARRVSLHGARGARAMVRGGDRSRDARPRVRVADGVARAAHVGRVLHAAGARGARRGSGALERVSPKAACRAAVVEAALRGDTPSAADAAVAADASSRRSRSSIPPAARARSSCTCSSASPTCTRAGGRRAAGRRGPPRRARARHPRRGRQPDGRVAVRAAALALGRDRERRDGA